MKRQKFIYCLFALIATSQFPLQNYSRTLTNIYLSQNSLRIMNINFEDSIDIHMLKKAKEIARRITIIDNHSHNLFQQGTKERPKQVSFSLLKNSGVKGIVQSFPLDFRAIKNPSEDILENIRDTKKRIKDESLKISLVLNSNDLISSHNNDSTKIIIGLEYFSGIFDGNIYMVEKYYKEGVREIGLVRIGGLDTIYVNNNLTRYGIDLINEINRLGILCDITHMVESAQLKVIEASKAPVILSHTNSYSVVNSGFNATDSVLERLTSKGGIICVTFFSGQLSKKALDHLNNKKDPNQLPRASIEELIDQIDYLKKKVGIDCIGIGTDYGGSGRMGPAGMETIENFPLIIYHMLKRGYTDYEIEKVMGLNFIRFFERVEKSK